MILRKSVIIPVLVLFILFTAMFVSLVSIYEMPERMMGAHDAYVLTSSTDNNPIRSNMDIRIAYGLENMSYITVVSPEIFVFTTLEGKAITVRGVEFKNFMALEDAVLVKGNLPDSPAGAIVGWRAAKSLGLRIGENLTLYGSFTPSVAVVHITGIFRANDPSDDEIMVSLSTARTLSGIEQGKVSIIRVRTNNVDKVEKLLSPLYPKFMVSMNSAHNVYIGDSFPVNLTVKNIGRHGGWANLTVKMENHTWHKRLYVQSLKKITVRFHASHVGSYNLTAVVSNDVFYYTNYTNIVVRRRPASIMGSTFAYTNITQKFTVLTLNGTFVKSGNITVVGPGEFNRTYEVNGTVNISFPYAGMYLLRFRSKYYNQANFSVHAYMLKNFDSLARLTPKPVGDVVYAPAGSVVKIITKGLTYYSINNGPLINSSVISMPHTGGTEYHVSINVVYRSYMANKSFILHAVYSNPPKIMAPVENGETVNYLENLTFRIVDYVPIKYVAYTINNNTHKALLNQSFSRNLDKYTYNFTVSVKSEKFKISVEADDVWNRTARFNASCTVLMERDIVKPKIIIPSNLKIWSGNRTEVLATDNVGIANLSVYAFGKCFNSTSGTVWIDTVNLTSTGVEFVSPGAYNVEVMAEDLSGNKNYTNFTLVINNTGEKNPPIIQGPSFADISYGAVKFYAYDNVGVAWIGIYNGSQMIKESFSNSIVLRSSDLNNGSYHLKIVSGDVNGNRGFIYATIVKNYTDTEKPVVVMTETKIWSGNTTWVIAQDNTKMKSLIVDVFGKTYTGTAKVAIHTKFVVNDNIRYISPGVYPVHVIAEDIYGNVKEKDFALVIENRGEKIPPEFILPEFEKVNATDNVSFRAFDNVGVSKVWLEYKNKIVVESNGSWLNFSASLLPCSYDSITIFAEDVNGNLGWDNITLDVMDNIPPVLKTRYVKVWSGQNIIFKAWDNVRVASIRVILFGKSYVSYNSTVIIPTLYIFGKSVNFVDPGNYTANITIIDSYGNENTTTAPVIINNTGEKIPPVIIGPSTGAVNITSSLTYFAYDNVGVTRMWIVLDGKIVTQSKGGNLTLNYGVLPAGTFNLTVFAEDVNGNNASLNSTVIVESIKHVDINATLQNSNITVDDRTNVIISLINQDVPAHYNVIVTIDHTPYYSTYVNLSPYEHRDIYVILPYLNPGIHRINVNGVTLNLTVTVSAVSKLPTDLVLKYSKNLKFTESKNVIYKGFQISEGNFTLVLAALISITLILVFLGLYSTAMKGLKNENIGILRAIGASNRQIFKFFMKESWLYFLVPGILGIAGGYLLVIGINSMDLLTAFGHHLTIVPTCRDIGIAMLITILFIFTSLFIIYWRLMHMHVTRIMGHGDAGKVVYLEELLRENS